jgi:hypothetical protein
VTPNSPVRDRRIVEHAPAHVTRRHLRERSPAHRYRRGRGRGRSRGGGPHPRWPDDRLLVVVGPCSVHDPVAALEYAEPPGRAGRHARPTSSSSSCASTSRSPAPRGLEGPDQRPWDLDGGFRVDEGLRTARALLLDIVGIGLPVGCEFLDPIIPQYLADAVSWGAIGARTAESQIHRQLASGLSMPVGIKNSTAGDVQVAVDAISAGERPGLHRDHRRRAAPPSSPRPGTPTATSSSGAAPRAQLRPRAWPPLDRLSACRTAPSPRRRRQPRQQHQGPRPTTGVVADLATRRDRRR